MMVTLVRLGWGGPGALPGLSGALCEVAASRLASSAASRHIGLYIPDELRRSISAPSAEGRWPGEDPALNKGPTPLPTALPGLLPQGGSSSLGFPPYNRFEFINTPMPVIIIGYE